MEGSSAGLVTKDSASMLNKCAICESKSEQIMLLTDYEQDNIEKEVPLREMMLALSGNKGLPSGRVCKNCVLRAKDAWKFQQQLQNANQEPSLSDKIRILRHRLKQLTQKMDVFIVVGPEQRNTENVEYSEDNVMMVDKNLPDDPFLDELETECSLECSVCSENFVDNSALLEHLKTHPSDAIHTCRICERGFSTRHQLISHKLRHKLKDSRECSKCLKVFKTVNELSLHECKISCPACSNVFDDCVELSKHIRANHGVASHDSSYACPICFEGFNTGVELEIHSTTHRQTKQYVCGHDGCVQRFSTEAYLLGHINETHFKVEEISELHQEVKMVFECGICQKTFNSEKSLKTHETRLHNTLKRGRGRPRSKPPSIPVAQSELSEPEPLEVVHIPQLDDINTLDGENVENLEEVMNVVESLDGDDFQMVYVGVNSPEGISYGDGEIIYNTDNDNQN